ncbi:MAG: polyprenyl synthetase family protein [Desulfopila sp.]|nr:polyprenyl synthetase family protein [Desulfopila sp.]
MSDIDTLLKLVQADIDTIDSTMSRDMETLEAILDSRLIEILRYGLFGGGKRFRPLLMILSSRLCGGKGEQLYTLAIAFEYLHMATLFHDDVIDQADTRRGKPSVCKMCGTAAAILAGDFLHARSMEMVGKIGGKKPLEIFCRATSAMVDGEFIQLRNANTFTLSEEEYFAAIEGKTALLISAATEIGALYGGGEVEKQLALKEYGRNLGYGFQIVDDILDYLGDAQTTGKAVGNDLVEGKMTLPLILALQGADGGARGRIYNVLTDADERRLAFNEVCRFIEKYDGFALARKKAEYCIEEALRHLKLFLPEENRDRQILEGLARYALQRKK